MSKFMKAGEMFVRDRGEGYDKLRPEVAVILGYTGTEMPASGGVYDHYEAAWLSPDSRLGRLSVLRVETEQEAAASVACEPGKAADGRCPAFITCEMWGDADSAKIVCCEHPVGHPYAHSVAMKGSVVQWGHRGRG